MSTPGSVAPAWRNDTGLAGSSVLVTGAAGGIGRAVARALGQAGAVVVAVDRPGTGVHEVVDELDGSGHLAREVDISDLTQHAPLMDQAHRAAGSSGRFAALIHTAAVMIRKKSVDDVTESDWDTQADVNLKATFFLNRAAWRSFREQGRGGSIVNFTSQGWWTGGFGGSVAYSATKGGIVSLSRGLARSFAEDLVRVNAIAPGGVDTGMFHEGLDAKTHQNFIAQIPLKRLAAPDEVAGAALFLASEASTYMTGTVLNLSGGQLVY